MKKWAVMLLVFALMMSASAQAAQWPEGRSPSQPYAGTPPLDLEKTMGYIMLYPRPKMPAQNFCDRLEIFLPREDVRLAHGLVHLMQTDDAGATKEVLSVDFSDADSVTLRPMTEQEMESVLWGSGVCIEIKLPVSLELNGKGYYVTMEEGCFNALNGAINSLAIVNPEAWSLTIEGEYGISGLYYTAPEEEPEEGETEEEPDEEPAEPVYKMRPESGDRVCFDLVMGGDAAYAVIYSENSSAFFEEIEYTQSQTVEGTFVKDEIDWGVVFLDAAGNVLKAITITR